MARLYLRKTLTGSFIPADEPSAELARKYKAGEVYRAEVVKPRSYQHHKLIMALLQLTYQNLPERYAGMWPTFLKFRQAMALEAGHCDYLVTLDGERKELPGSLSYDALDEVRFTQVSGALMTICTKILDVSEPELAAEVSRFADDTYGRAA